MRRAAFSLVLLLGCGGIILGAPDDASSPIDAAVDHAAHSEAGLDALVTPDHYDAKCYVLQPLLAYFPLDGDTSDHSGNGNDAVGANLVPTAGLVGGAMHFDGASSTLRVSGSAELQGPRTFCAWVRPTATTGLGQPVFWGGAEGAGDFFSISANTPSGGTCSAAKSNTPFVDHWGTACEETYVPASLGEWNFVCYAYDGAQMQIEIGNGMAPTQPSGPLYDYPLDTLFIGSTGAAGTTTNHSFAGDIDEVTIWSAALQGGDMNALYHDGAGCQGGLVTSFNQDP